MSIVVIILKFSSSHLFYVGNACFVWKWLTTNYAYILRRLILSLHLAKFWFIFYSYYSISFAFLLSFYSTSLFVEHGTIL